MPPRHRVRTLYPLPKQFADSFPPLFLKILTMLRAQIFLTQAQVYFGSIDLSADEVDAIGRLMLNLKKRPSSYKKEINRLDQSLDSKIANDVCKIMEAYCTLELTNEQRDFFVDLIFDSVVDEKDSESATDSECSSEDETVSYYSDKDEYEDSISWESLVELPLATTLILAQP